MKSPELVELCQALLEILRAAVPANQDREVAPVAPGGAAYTANVKGGVNASGRDAAESKQ